MHKYILYIVLFAITISCNKKTDFKTTDGGLEYTFIETNDSSKQAKYGDVISVVMQIYAHDSLLFDTREIDFNYRMLIDTPDRAGSINEGFALMHMGDSAIFITDAFEFYHYTANVPQPDFIKKGDKLYFYVRLMNILSQEDLRREQERIERRLSSQEQMLLKDYLKRVNIDVGPTKDGLYFVLTKKTRGVKPKIGDSVFIHYTVSLTNNMPLESTLNRNPYAFVYGDSSQIKGINLGIGMMHEGEEATLIIPSSLAYGNERVGIISPYSTLIFYVKLVKVKHN